MRFLPALMLCPALALMGQSDPPPEVEQALRARVSEFFGYHVEGNFRKAYDLVADDTKDYYFATQKNQFLSFKIGQITYSENFTYAVVRVDGERKIRLRPEFPETVIIQPMVTTWKIENGKWVWYVDKSTLLPTPMSNGPHPLPVPSPNDITPKLPDLSEKAIQGRAQDILKKSGVDKTSVWMSAKQESTEHVTFHNGQAGFVRVYLDPGPPVEGFSAKIEKNELNAGEDVVVTLHYVPGKTPPPGGVAVKLNLEPFSQTFPIAVKFAQ